jgi:hypothetical protein
MSIGDMSSAACHLRHVRRGGTMAVQAADAWSIARFCALVAQEADDDLLCRSLINIRDVWIEIANECELLAGHMVLARREAVG